MRDTHQYLLVRRTIKSKRTLLRLPISHIDFFRKTGIYRDERGFDTNIAVGEMNYAVNMMDGSVLRSDFLHQSHAVIEMQHGETITILTFRDGNVQTRSRTARRIQSKLKRMT